MKIMLTDLWYKTINVTGFAKWVLYMHIMFDFKDV